MKIILFLFVLSCSVVLGQAPNSTSSDLYVLLIGANGDPNRQYLNNRITKALDSSRLAFTLIAQHIDAQLHLVEISGNDFNPTNIKTTLERLQTTPKQGQRTTFLIILGILHGTNFDHSNSRLPYLVLDYKQSNELLSSEQIYNDFIENSEFDHIHIWLEACNGIQTGVAPNNILGSNTQPSKGRNPMFALLSSVKSEIIVAASYGQYALQGILNYGLFKSLDAVVQHQIAPCFDCPNGFFENIYRLSEIQVPGRDWKQQPVAYVEEIPKGTPTPTHNHQSKTDKVNLSKNTSLKQLLAPIKH